MFAVSYALFHTQTLTQRRPTFSLVRHLWERTCFFSMQGLLSWTLVYQRSRPGKIKAPTLRPASQYLIVITKLAALHEYPLSVTIYVPFLPADVSRMKWTASTKWSCEHLSHSEVVTHIGQLREIIYIYKMAERFSIRVLWVCLWMFCVCDECDIVGM